MQSFFQLFPEGKKRDFEIKIKIHKAEGLTITEGVALNPYCKVSLCPDMDDLRLKLDSEIKMTSRRLLTNEPVWEEEFTL